MVRALLRRLLGRDASRTGCSASNADDDGADAADARDGAGAAEARDGADTADADDDGTDAADVRDEAAEATDAADDTEEEEAEDDGSVWDLIPRWQYDGRHVETGGMTRGEQERALADIQQQAREIEGTDAVQGDERVERP